MFARIPEIPSSLISSQSWTSRKDLKSPPPTRRLDTVESAAKEKTAQSPEPTKNPSSSAKSKTSGERPSSITEELCMNNYCRGRAGLDLLKVISRRVSAGSVGQTRSLNFQQLESPSKMTSIVLSVEPVRRLSGGSFSISKVAPELMLEEGVRRNSESYQYRRRSSRDSSSRRRSSLVLTGSNYRVGRKIGSGNFGEIHLGKNLSTDEMVAIKLESIKARYQQLNREYNIYKKLGQPPVEGFAIVHFWSTYLRFNALVMELLGPNLNDLLLLCGNKFTMKTVLMIALQIIRRIQFVHSKSILYRDVKPENFVIGRLEGRRHIIHMIDFGLSKDFIDPETQEHIAYKENRGITGTARYVSVNVHQGKEVSRRDDLEAVGYMLIYFLKGSLPWQGQKLANDVETLKAVCEIKTRTSIDELCRGCPREFSVFLHYVRGLGFYDPPDYDFLSKLFQDLLEKTSVSIDWKYDWTEFMLYTTPSGMLVTHVPDERTEPADVSLPEQLSGYQGGYQSNKAIVSYENLIREVSGSSGVNLKGSGELSTTRSRRVSAPREWFSR